MTTYWTDPANNQPYEVPDGGYPQDTWGRSTKAEYDKRNSELAAEDAKRIAAIEAQGKADKAMYFEVLTKTYQFPADVASRLSGHVL